MKTNSSNKRINIIDLIVVVAIVIIVIALGVKTLASSGLKEKTEASNSNLTYTVEVKMSDRDILSHLKEGQKIYDGVSKKEIGQVVSVHDAPARVLVENFEKRKLEFCEYPEKIDVAIEVEAKANMAHPDITVNEFSLKIGKRVDCIVGDATMTGTIIGLDYDATLMTKKEEK